MVNNFHPRCRHEDLATVSRATGRHKEPSIVPLNRDSFRRPNGERASLARAARQCLTGDLSRPGHLTAERPIAPYGELPDFDPDGAGITVHKRCGLNPASALYFKDRRIDDNGTPSAAA